MPEDLDLRALAQESVTWLAGGVDQGAYSGSRERSEPPAPNDAPAPDEPPPSVEPLTDPVGEHR